MSAARNARPLVHLFAEGFCRGHAGPGGWAYVIKKAKTAWKYVDCESAPDTARRRMALQAAMCGLRTLDVPSRVELTTTSAYLVSGVNKRLTQWKQDSRLERQEIENADLWCELDEILQHHDAQATRIYGHKGHPENEECRRMAREMAGREHSMCVQEQPGSEQLRVVFRQFDAPGLVPGIHWQAELHSPTWDFGVPVATAWVTRYTLHGDGPAVEFVLVPDQFRRQGYAKLLIKACRDRWPNLWLTDGISPAGKALRASLEREKGWASKDAADGTDVPADSDAA
jgi:ribonuclease HI